MSKGRWFWGIGLFAMVLANHALAGSQVMTFDTNNWGTSTWGTYNTIISFENSGGNPGACLLLRGISGVGASFSNQGFTGDFAAAGYGRIAFDLKLKRWFPISDQPAPAAYVFVRRSIAHDPWCKQIPSFDPSTTDWKRYAVSFDPDWNDAEATARGWQIIHFPGATDTAPFRETLHNVFQTGMWVKVSDGGAECHILLDNYSLLPGLPIGLLKEAPAKALRKPPPLKAPVMIIDKPKP